MQHSSSLLCFSLRKGKGGKKGNIIKAAGGRGDGGDRKGREREREKVRSPEMKVDVFHRLSSIRGAKGTVRGEEEGVFRPWGEIRERYNKPF